MKRKSTRPKTAALNWTVLTRLGYYLAQYYNDTSKLARIDI